jgi:outer membrane receptor protein involved in Fe transport
VFDKRHFRVAGVNLALNWKGFHGLHEWGAEAKELTADYQYSSHVHFEPSLLFPGLAPDTDRNLSVRPDGWKYAAYWTSRFALGDRWVTDLGLRAEDQGYTGPEHSVQLNPRASLLYTLSPQTRIRASWGQFSQSQRINELQLEDGVDSFAPAQHAKHAVLSLDHSLSPAVLLRIEAYRKDYSQLKARYENLFDTLVLLPELQADRVRVAPSSARMDGIETSVSWRPEGPWSGWFNYSWSEAEDTVDGHKVLRSWDQKHAVSTGLRWARGQWDVTVADTWHTGWPTTAVSLETVGTTTTAIIGPRNGDRLKSFNSLDVRASYRFMLPRGDLEAFVEVTNLGNQGNPCCYDYRTTTLPDGSVVLDQDVNNWLGIVPSVGVLWKY